MTRENDAHIAYVKATGIDVFAGYTTNGKHAPGSWHGREGTPSGSGDVGLAIDWDAMGNNPTKLLACARSFKPVEHLLAELLHTPLGYSIKNGKRVGLIDAKNHYNHVHVATTKGTFLVAPFVVQPKKETPVLITNPADFADRPQGDGGWAVDTGGRVYTSDAALWFGNWDDNTRSGDRICVAIVETASGQGYWLVSNRGEIYAFGDAPQTGNYQSRWGAGVIVGAYRNTKQPNGGVTLVRDDGVRLNRYHLPA